MPPHSIYSLPFLDIAGVDADYYIEVFLQHLKHRHLVVGVESGKDARCVKVVKKLPSAFDI